MMAAVLILHWHRTVYNSEEGPAHHSAAREAFKKKGEIFHFFYGAWGVQVNFHTFYFYFEGFPYWRILFTIFLSWENITYYYYLFAFSYPCIGLLWSVGTTWNLIIPNILLLAKLTQIFII